MVNTVLHRVSVNELFRGFAPDSSKGLDILVKTQGSCEDDAKLVQEINNPWTRIVSLLESRPENEQTKYPALIEKLNAFSGDYYLKLGDYPNACALMESIDKDLLDDIARYKIDLSDLPPDQLLSASIADTLQRVDGTIDPDQRMIFLAMFIKAGSGRVSSIHDWHNEDRYPHHAGKRQIHVSLSDEGMMFALANNFKRRADKTFDVSAGVALPRGISVFDFLDENVHAAPPPSVSNDRFSYSLTCVPKKEF